MKTIILLLLSLVIGACGESDDTPSPDGMTTESLTCKSLALCTSHEVKRFNAPQSTPQGGTIEDGTYVLAWTRTPAEFQDEGYTGESIEAIRIQGGEYRWASFFNDNRGTWKTDGTTLEFNASHECDLADEKEADASTRDIPYTASDNQLVLYMKTSSSKGTWFSEEVYVRKGATDICDTDGEPNQEGPSAQCRVTNCYCAVTEGGSIDYENQCN